MKYSFSFIDITSPRTILKRLIHPENPNTTITENNEFPNRARINTIKNITGKAKSISLNLLRTESTHPPQKAAEKPRQSPKIIAIITDARPTKSEILAP